MSAKQIVALLVGAVALLATACSEGDTVVNTPGAEASGITVTGTGQAFGVPDIALITLGVQAEAANVADARETAAQRAQAVIDSVKANGVADKDIQTTQFDIQPQYDFSPTGRGAVRSYQVTNVLSIKVRKIDTTGKVLDDATRAGGNNAVVRGISFTIDDPTKLREEARAKALAEAKTKADQLARDAGVKLGKPVSITEGGGPVPLPASALVAPRTGDTSTPIQTGELQVNITVTVRYEID